MTDQEFFFSSRVVLSIFTNFEIFKLSEWFRELVGDGQWKKSSEYGW